MTQKHFVALAAALKASKPGVNWAESKFGQWKQDVQAVARVCSDMNPRFNYADFYAACGCD